jgi:pullulanase/glycogen debranching enzyme
MEIKNALMNGTSLPKGHGRLIDADELKKHKYHDNDRYENAVSIAQVDWQPTIIEADKESEE